MTYTDAPTELTAAAAAVREANGRVILAVIDARDQGMSWTEIGKILGVTKQAAAQKYGKSVEGAAAQRAAAPAPAPQLDGQTTIEVDAEVAPATEPTSAGQDFYACDANGCEWTITTPVEDWRDRERAIDHHELSHSVGARITAVTAGNMDSGRGNCDDLGNVLRVAGAASLRHAVYNGSHALAKCAHCGTASHYTERAGYWMYEGCETTKKDHSNYKAGKR